MRAPVVPKHLQSDAQAAEMVSNLAFKSRQAEAAQNNAAAGSRLLLEGSKGKKGIWGTEVRAPSLPRKT